MALSSATDATKTDTPVASHAPQPELDSTLELLEGAVVGRGYRILKLLGEGGMGAVYLASSPEGETVALKLIRGQQDEEARKRFVREVRAMQAIENPHVVRVLDADTDAKGGFPFLVMELLEGRDLAAIIREQGALDPAKTARIFVQACRGLAAIHQIGVVHRDIKPSNLFLHTRGGIAAKVCDFGVAKNTTSESTSSDLTHTGGIVGSPHYMSPEQVQDSKRVDHRSDLWSLSMAMYEALSGHKGWAGCSTVGELLVAVCTKDLPWLQDEAPWVPGGLASIVHRNLFKAPAERFASASEMADALEPFAAPVGSLSLDALAASEAVRAVRASIVSPARGVGTLSGTRVSGGSSKGPILIGAAVVAGLLAGGLGLLKERGAPASVAGRLRVPAAASVWVQGKPRPNAGGRVDIDAAPGEAISVALELHGKRADKVVTVTSKGQIIPDELTFDPDPAGLAPSGSAPPGSAPPGSAPPGAASASAAPAGSAAPEASAAASASAAQPAGQAKGAKTKTLQPAPPPTQAATTAAPAPTPTSTLQLQTKW